MNLEDEDPKRAFRWFVEKDNNVECALDIQTVQRTFNERWAPVVDYMPPEENNVFRLPEVLQDEDRSFLCESLKDPSTYEKIIKSRSQMSAAGPDGITYSIIKAGEKSFAKILSIISKAMIQTGKFPKLWAQSTSLLIYKKGDANDINNWRPLSIASSAYRIWACAVSNSLQDINRRRNLISSEQKGFIRGINGCMEHSIIGNEVLNDAKRTQKDLHVVSIDLRDAFGSVPHDYIQEVLAEVGLPKCMRRVIQSSFDQSTTRFQIGRSSTQDIAIRKGVKQGCPLSPMLFDMCIEPFIRHITQDCRQLGYHVGKSDKIVKVVQAYADDLILFSDNAEHMERLLKELELFLRYSKLNVNNGKCRTLSIGHRNNMRVELQHTFMLNDIELPRIDLSEGTEYLGIMLSNNKPLRFKSAEEIVHTAIKQINKLESLPFRFNQRIDAVKRFIIPSLDYILSNGETYQKTINELEGAIKKLISNFLGNKGVLRDFFKVSWKDGGLGIQPIDEREKALRIKSLVALTNIASDETREFMKLIIDEERVYRDINAVPVNDSSFLNWETDANGNIIQRGTHGTDSLIIRAMKAAKALNLCITYDDEHFLEVYDKDAPGTPAMTNPKEITKKITEKTRNSKWEALTQHNFHGHSFTTLKDSRDSNYFIGNYSSKMSEKMMRFVLKGRLNLLPTGELKDKIDPQNAPHRCPKCNNGTLKDSLMHELNGCVAIRNKLTRRHNAVQNVLKKEIENKYKTPVFTNCQIKIGNQRIPTEAGNLKPDLWFLHDDVINVVEFSIPYGDMKNMNGARVDSLEDATRAKEEKYREMIEDAKRTFNKNVRFYPIIISSLGAITKKTSSNIAQILRATKTTTKKVARRMIYEAIRGSFLIFYDITDDSRDGRETAQQSNQIGSLRNEEPDSDHN